MDINKAQKTLHKAGIEHSIQELHGMMCSALISTVSFEMWLDELAYLEIQKDALSSDATELLEDVFATAFQQVQAGDMKFDLPLPDIKTCYANRVCALSEWCSGFIYGVGIWKIMQTKQLSNQSMVFIEEVGELSLGAKDINDNESERKENEIAWQQIVEYLCIGVLTLFDDVQPTRHSGNSHPPPC